MWDVRDERTERDFSVAKSHDHLIFFFWDESRSVRYPALDLDDFTRTILSPNDSDILCQDSSVKQNTGLSSAHGPLSSAKPTFFSKRIADILFAYEASVFASLLSHLAQEDAMNILLRSGTAKQCRSVKN